jgi:dihydrofolate reductase
MRGFPLQKEKTALRTVIYSMGVSLDCYIAGPDGNGWGAPDAELHRFHNQQTRELGLHLLGRRLYEVMAFWETAEERNPLALPNVSELDVAQVEFARIWKQLPKLVFSKTLEAVEGNARLSRADPVQTVRALKEENGGPIAVGGADLAATLTAHQLIDEYHLFVYPVALGRGKPFFADDTRVDLELLETRTFSNRVVYLRYRRPDT